MMTTSGVMIGGLDLNGVEPTGVQWVTSDVEGWGAPSGTLAPVQKPRHDGAWGGVSYRKPRSIVISGACVAPTADLASDALDRLSAAVALSDTVLTVSESGRQRWANVRRDGEVLPVWMGSTAFTFSAQVAALDPRKFGSPVTASTALPSTTGGLTVPFTVPFTISAMTVTGQIALTNPGTVNGPVALRIAGPVTGPIVTHVASGRSLVFSSSITLGAGEWLDVDAEAMSVLANGQSSRNGWVTSRGWPLFEPGSNIYAFTAATFSAGALLTVTGTPAWE